MYGLADRRAGTAPSLRTNESSLERVQENTCLRYRVAVRVTTCHTSDEDMRKHLLAGSALILCVYGTEPWF